MVQPNRPPIVELGPQHAGIRLAADEFDRTPVADGYRYELIDGVLEVAPAPDPYAGEIAEALRDLLKAHVDPHGAPVFKQVRLEPRIIIRSDLRRMTNPQPDVAAYLDYPARPATSYVDVFPVLVVEIVTPDSIEKDYVRNRRLYASVPQILEYWIIDPTDDVRRPKMAVHHRDAAEEPFARLDVAAGGVYAASRWPGLTVDLARIAVD